MKIAGLVVLAALLLSLHPVRAQTGNIFHVRTFTSVMPPGGSARERDSLLAEYLEHVVRKNDKIVSARHFRHYFGKDSRDWVLVVEYRKLEDYEAAVAVNQELSRKRWPDEAKRADFNRKLLRYWEPQHSDEVLRIVPGLSK